MTPFEVIIGILRECSLQNKDYFVATTSENEVLIYTNPDIAKFRNILIDSDGDVSTFFIGYHETGRIFYNADGLDFKAIVEFL